MGRSRVLLTGAVCSLIGGCALFDDGGDAHQIAAAKATADGLIAFADINNNLTTDATAAGEAAQKFLVTPLAARDLVSPPFAFSDGATLEKMRTTPVVPGDLPGCVTTMGPGGCDSFQANECEAGPLTFGGSGSRMCPGCPNNPDVFGACTYSWDMNVALTTPEFALEISNTTGTETVSAMEVGTTRISFLYTLTTPNGFSLPGERIEVCACGPLTTDAGPPRKLVAGKFLVRKTIGENTGILEDGCAIITFNNNEPSADFCPNSTTGLSTACDEGSDECALL